MRNRKYTERCVKEGNKGRDWECRWITRNWDADCDIYETRDRKSRTKKKRQFIKRINERKRKENEDFTKKTEKM